MATIQRQEGEAVVVDGYKAMYDQLMAERGALVERAVDLEYQNKVLAERVSELEKAPNSSTEKPSSSKVRRRSSLLPIKLSTRLVSAERARRIEWPRR